MSDLIFTAVPSGIAPDGRHLLRVLVVPRLDGGTVAGSGMAAWPPAALLEGRSMFVQWASEEDVSVTTLPVAPEDVTFAVQPGLWARFFGPDMNVGGEAGATGAWARRRPSRSR